MEHPPRFDDIMKSKLALQANSTMRELWVVSPLKEKIFIGFHSLDCYSGGSTHLGRYMDQKTGRYDAVHFYGKTGARDYTDSVKSIMMMTLQQPGAAPPSPGPGSGDDQNQWSQSQQQNQTGNPTQYRHGNQSNKGAQHNYSVPTQNRFGVFNQGN